MLLRGFWKEKLPPVKVANVKFKNDILFFVIPAVSKTEKNSEHTFNSMPL